MRSYQFYAFNDIELEDGYLIEDSPFGETVAIEDQEGLERAIVRTFVFKEDGLTGAQIKALRRGLELTQLALAELLRIDRQTVLRWESGASTPSRAEDFFVRFFAAERWFSRDAIGLKDGREAQQFPTKLRFKWTGSRWVSRQFPAVHSLVIGKTMLTASSLEKTFIDSIKMTEVALWREGAISRSDLVPTLAAVRLTNVGGVMPPTRKIATQTGVFESGSECFITWSSQYDVPLPNDLELASDDVLPSVPSRHSH